MQTTKHREQIIKMKFLTTKLFVLSAIFLCAISVSAQKESAISAVQGELDKSPFEGKSVKLEGIVTARLRAGFFIQTPDDKTDNNPKTSEGIYVFTKSEPNADATVGNLVSVTGTIDEYAYKTALTDLTITELSMDKNVDTIRVISKENPLPKPVAITPADFVSNETSAYEKISRGISVFEKYEGMRVVVPEMTVVAPTYGKYDYKTGTSVSQGTFYGVLKGTPRPFREIGMDIHDIESLKSKDREKFIKEHPKITIFDSNPEAIRVDSNEQLGSQTIDVTVRTEIKNLTGVMHYGFGKYTILTDVKSNMTIGNGIKSAPLPIPTEDQFTIAGMNVENFFDDEDDPASKEDIVTSESFTVRMQKISLAIRDYLRFPDVVGVIEAESINGLKRLADKINADAVANKQTNPKYEAYLVPGIDPRGINVGFLVKSSRIKVVKVEQFGKDESYDTPKGKESQLNDRPSLLIEATIDNPTTGKPFAFTVIVNHLKSLNGYDDPKDGGLRVRTKKVKQAEFLAKFIQQRQKNNPNENLIMLGDFNAYQFNDGITDIIGTIKGTPAGKDEILMPSDDLVNPDLIDMVDLIQADQRYSYTFDGNAQTLDHVLINQTMRKHLLGFGFGRFNADFPETYRNDPTRVERYSDHDAAIGYFSIEERSAAQSAK